MGSFILCPFFRSQFSSKKYDILQVHFWPDIWSLTVCSESHKSAMVACVLVRWHSWTWFVYVVGPIRLVSWPAWRARYTPDFEDAPAFIMPVSWCALDSNKCSCLRLFGVKIISLLKASMTVPQREFPSLWLVKIHSPGAHPLFSYVAPFDINIGQFDQAGSVRHATGWEAPELSKSDDTLTNWGLTLEVRGTTGCTRVLGDGIGATGHEWGCWCFGATQHLYPYRMKCGLGDSVVQNTTAISLVFSFSLIFPFWLNYVELVWRMNANRLIWPY